VASACDFDENHSQEGYRGSMAAGHVAPHERSKGTVCQFSTGVLVQAILLQEINDILIEDLEALELALGSMKEENI
jgi:hypothetical protein